MIEPRRILYPVLLMVAAACSGSAANHESLGDRAYLRRDFPAALVEYQLAVVQRDRPGLRLKAGLAALKAMNRLEAVSQFAQVATAGGYEKLGLEALERVARQAMEAGDTKALRAALQALFRIDRERALGGFAGELARELGERPAAADAEMVLLHAAAAAPNAEIEDSIVFSYATRLRRNRNCRDAIIGFEGLVRRGRAPGVIEESRKAIGRCALQLGRAALNRGDTDSAAVWYTRAIVSGADSDYARAAYIGLGDVRARELDFVGAAEAYQRAMVGAPADSIFRRAAEKLKRLADAGTVIPQ